MTDATDKPLTVLVVDDIVSNAKLMALIMENMFKARVILTYSARVALEQAVAQRPDLMMVDINMPSINGYQFLEEIRAMAEFKNTPIVSVSANALPEDVARGLSSGFNAYITKPYDFDDVWRSICPLLGRDPNSPRTSSA
jgi:CheY-like chemotaxis protein